MFAAISLVAILLVGQSTAFLAPAPLNTRLSSVSTSSLYLSENNYDNDDAATSSRRDFFTKSTTTTAAAIATLLTTATSKPAIAEEVPTVVVAGATGQTG